MASLVLTLHSKTPELRKIKKITEAMNEGAVVLYPTDTGFTLGCELSNKNAIEKIRAIRRISEAKSMTFLTDSLSNLSLFAKVSNSAYRVINALIPGPYTFILPASKLVPKFAQNPKRKTAGLRVPDNRLCRALLTELGSPIISISAKMDGIDGKTDPEAVLDAFISIVDVAVRSDEYNFQGESTIIDMTNDDKFSILRAGAGYDLVENFMTIDEQAV